MTTSERIKAVRKQLGLSQEEFGQRIGVSRDVIGNIEYDRLKRPEQKEPIYRLICKEYDINEEWLRTGEGEMKRQLSRDEQITDFMGDVLKDRPESFKKRFVSMLSSLNDDQWVLLEQMAIRLLNEKEE
jgi:transcriptional regulator with XRE-family HTH domain